MGKEKFSYSKIETFERCPYKYQLVYRDKHFVNDKSINLEFGTLVHYIEESIGKYIRELGDDFQYLFDINPFIDMFINLNDTEHNIFGMKKLKEKYPVEFNEKNKAGLDFTDKGNLYLNSGIYRLYNFLLKNPNLKIIGLEKKFDLEYQNCIFHGVVDRIFQDVNTGKYYIEDIKTYSEPLDKKDLTTPLQFVFYSLAVQQIFNVSEDAITCAYELPLCDCKQDAGTKGFMKRGQKKLDQLLEHINAGDMEPKPSCLCNFCVFSPTFKNQPDDAKNLCPYYCNWTKKNNHDYSVANEWMGKENHQAILDAFIRQNTKQKPIIIVDDAIKNNIPILDISQNIPRRLLLRR